MTTRQLMQDGLPVPYIALWSHEANVTPPLVARRLPGGIRLAYEDETLYDRDHYGALWIRKALARGKGRARLHTVHPMRQRRAINHDLCQICQAPATVARRQRALYLLPAAHGPLVEGTTTVAPPVCVSCAPKAVEYCPRLRDGWNAAWVEDAPLWGVGGVVYDPHTLKPLPGQRGLLAVPYGDPDIRWTLAERQAVSLHGLTPVHDLYNLAA